MQIQVLGSGCTTCKRLFELTQKAVTELQVDKELEFTSKVEYITDVTKILEMGIMSSPVLAIDGKPVMIGATNDIERIKNLIKHHKDNQTT